MADAKALVDVACDRVVEPFKLKNLKIYKENIRLEKLVTGRYVFGIQPTRTMVVDT